MRGRKLRVSPHSTRMKKLIILFLFFPFFTFADVSNYSRTPDQVIYYDFAPNINISFDYDSTDMFGAVRGTLLFYVGGDVQNCIDLGVVNPAGGSINENIDLTAVMSLNTYVDSVVFAVGGITYECADQSDNYNGFDTPDGTFPETTEGGIFLLEEAELGCIDPSAENYNEDAIVDDDSCLYVIQTVNNPVMNFFFGFVIFFISMMFPIWLFRRK